MTSTAGERGRGADNDGSGEEDESEELTPRHDTESRTEQDESGEIESPQPLVTASGLEDDPIMQHDGDQEETYNSLYSELEKAQGAVSPFSEASDLPPELEVAHIENPNGPSSTPDDSPSFQGSIHSSPSESVPRSQTSTPSNFSPSPQPFERRFQARRTSSQFNSSRTASPAFLTTHSRQQSASSQLSYRSQSDTADENEQRPWEVVRWTRLKKITAQAFSEAGKRTFGRPVYLTVGAFIALGTSKGIILLFDYQQALKSIIGQGTAAAECGSITSLAISADHTTIAGGHADGSIFTWDIARPAKPFLQVSPIPKNALMNRNIDGHVLNCSVLHVGFLGTRRTALVSADDSGMAFSHLATRGLGAVGRTVKTTRILGRYPDVSMTLNAPRKPSSVLAFAPLPLGNVERATDDLGLTALLTPYLLVIVSTTPIAQTQYKTPRAKQVAAHSAMTGCLAWFPSVKLKDSAYAAKQRVSVTKLVYCWSNVLHVLEVQEISEPAATEQDKRPNLSFRQRGSWQSDEAIVAVQWLSRSIIVVLTITQRLIILEDKHLRVSDSSDLNSKHIFYQDLFSRQLQPLVDKMEQDDPTMHGVVPNAYHMSFKAYKSRLFLLGTGDVSMGLMSNWADRLVALMGAGSYISAINLATTYYEGSSDNVTIGLPEDDSTRHDMVQEKVLDMISASLRYLFSEDQKAETDKDIRSQLSELVGPIFHACFTMKTIDFLFDDVYEWYSDASCQDVFLNTLEPHIIDGRVSSVPPGILKDLMNWYGAHGLSTRLEEMIISLETESMDIDQVTSLCKVYDLYDALIHVFNEALDDYISPFIELLSIIKNLQSNHLKATAEDNERKELAGKTFPYLAYTLTGRRYPDGADIPVPRDTRAKGSLYGFLFSSKALPWPQPRSKPFKLRDDGGPEPSYPYLHLLLRYDAPNFLSMLNEAFEDSFLNDDQEQFLNGDAPKVTSIEAIGRAMNRQSIITTLQEIMRSTDFGPLERTYLDIFIARNVAKFSLLLVSSTLRTTLTNLCNYPQDDLADECQLSVEYLLSVYRPSDIQSFTSIFEKAGFFRILKSIYRANKQYAKWIETYFQDPEDRLDVFASIGDCLRPNSGLSKRQIQDVKTVLLAHAKDMEKIDVSKTAVCITRHAPDLLDQVYESLDEPKSQYLFLQAILEPSGRHLAIDDTFANTHMDYYVQLMCRFDPHHVADYVRLVNAGDLKLEAALPTMENSGVIDAAVILMAKDGLVREAMNRLIKYLNTLQTALIGLLSEISQSPDFANAEETSDDLLEDIEKYVKLGIWLCQGQTPSSEPGSAGRRHKMHPSDITEDQLTIAEFLWLDLIDAVVAVSRTITSAAENSSTIRTPGKEQDATETPLIDSAKIAASMRSTVQQAFTALLASTTNATTSTSRSRQARPATNANSQPPAQAPSFLPILRLFLTRAARHSPTLSDLRSALSNIFAAYTFEESILALANEFIDKDIFLQVEAADRQRRAGWRPKSQVCEGCRRRVWGVGAGGALWEEWRAKKLKEAVEKEKRTRLKEQDNDPSDVDIVHRGKGKGKALTMTVDTVAAEIPEAEDLLKEARADRPPADSIVLFSCMHLWHRNCLERAGGATTKGEQNDGGSARESDSFECPLCSS